MLESAKMEASLTPELEEWQWQELRCDEEKRRREGTDREGGKEIVDLISVHLRTYSLLRSLQPRVNQYF